MSALRRRRYMGTCTRRYRRQAATIGDDIARNKKICFLRRSPMGILLYCYLKTMRRTKRRENRGLLRLLNKQKRMISISWSLYESFQQFITREVKTKEKRKLLDEDFRIAQHYNARGRKKVQNDSYIVYKIFNEAKRKIWVWLIVYRFYCSSV